MSARPMTKSAVVVTLRDHGLLPGDKLLIEGREYMIDRATTHTVTPGPGLLRRWWLQLRGAFWGLVWRVRLRLGR